MASPKEDKSFYLSTAEPATRRRLYKIIRSLSQGDYQVHLVKKQKRVTAGQRGYYWGYLLVEVGRLIGYDRDQADKILNSRFLVAIWEVSGESVRVVRSLADLDPVEAANYFANVRMWAWEKYRVRLLAPDRLLRKEEAARSAS